MSTQAVMVGLFGGRNGAPHDITEKTALTPASLQSLNIWSKQGDDDGIINAISFTFVADGNHPFTVDPWGAPPPGQDPTNIDMTNVLMKGLSGYTDGKYITSLTFITNDTVGKHGPFGKKNPKVGVDTPFSIPLKNGTIVAFFAQADDNLSAIGAYLKA